MLESSTFHIGKRSSNTSVSQFSISLVAGTATQAVCRTQKESEPASTMPGTVDGAKMLAVVLIVMLNTCTAVCEGELLSVSNAVNVNVPVLVGVPLICPEGDNASPAGRAPLESDQK